MNKPIEDIEAILNDIYQPSDGIPITQPIATHAIEQLLLKARIDELKEVKDYEPITDSDGAYYGTEWYIKDRIRELERQLNEPN